MSNSILNFQVLSGFISFNKNGIHSRSNFEKPQQIVANESKSVVLIAKQEHTMSTIQTVKKYSQFQRPQHVFEVDNQFAAKYD